MVHRRFRGAQTGIVPMAGPGVQIVPGPDLLRPQDVFENPAAGARVVFGPVVAFLRDPQTFRNEIELVFPFLGREGTRQCQRVHDDRIEFQLRLAARAHAEPFISEEAQVEKGIVGTDRAVPDEREEIGKDIGGHRGFPDHVVGDAGQILYFGGQRNARTDERGK